MVFCWLEWVEQVVVVRLDVSVIIVVMENKYGLQRDRLRSVLADNVTGRKSD